MPKCVHDRAKHLQSKGVPERTSWGIAWNQMKAKGRAKPKGSNKMTKEALADIISAVHELRKEAMATLYRDDKGDVRAEAKKAKEGWRAARKADRARTKAKGKGKGTVMDFWESKARNSKRKASRAADQVANALAEPGLTGR